VTTFCTADEIATAIVAAARLEGEDPEAIARGAQPSRARWYAAAALFDAFPDNDYRAIALGCGFLTQSTMVSSRSLVGSYRRGKGAKWWDESRVEVVAAALAKFRESAPPAAPVVEAPQQLLAPIAAPLVSPAAAASAASQFLGLAAKPAPMRDAGSLPIKRAARLRVSVTAAILGDPPPDRSALAQRLEKNTQRETIDG
jgi:hypothetical protein